MLYANASGMLVLVLVENVPVDTGTMYIIEILVIELIRK